MNIEPIPVTSKVTIAFPIGDVKDSIRFLIEEFPQYFIPQKNGINEDLGTYVFNRPKGVDTPTIRLTLSAVDENNTNVEFHCSSSSITSSTPDMQVAITEVLNILIDKLNGKSIEEIKETIKKNNSGNGVFGCFKSIGCIVFFLITCGAAFLYIMSGIVKVFIN